MIYVRDNNGDVIKITIHRYGDVKLSSFEKEYQRSLQEIYFKQKEVDKLYSVVKAYQKRNYNLSEYLRKTILMIHNTLKATSGVKLSHRRYRASLKLVDKLKIYEELYDKLQDGDFNGKE